MTQLDELQAERVRIVRRLREMSAARDRGEDWDDDEEIRLSRALAGVEAQIRELGGTLQPVPSGGGSTSPGGTQPAEAPAKSQPPAAASTHLGMPPESIDQQWNELIENYKRAQQAAADHALARRDDWTCSHADPRVHAGCGIWWRGQRSNHLTHLRDAANRLLDDLAGPRTQQEFANDQAMIDLRTDELAPLEVEIARAERRLAELLQQFEEDEVMYKALRDAGGDVAPYSGLVSAGRHRLLFDIAKVQNELADLYNRRTTILTRLLEMRRQAGSVRRDRGLAEARRRWPELDLDLDAMTDDELLRALLGDEQYERMQAELRRQGTQMNRQRNRRTSWMPSRVAVFVAILALFALAFGAVVWATRDSDEVAGESGADISETDDDVGGADVVDDVVGQVVDEVAEVAECVLHTDLELLEILVEPGSHHQGNIAVSVSDRDDEPVDGAEVHIRTEKSDGTATEASSISAGGRVIFGMRTTAYGENTLFVTDVVMPNCTWDPGAEPSLTWQAVP
jgi:hypothetical protein